MLLIFFLLKKKPKHFIFRLISCMYKRIKIRMRTYNDHKFFFVITKLLSDSNNVLNNPNVWFWWNGDWLIIRFSLLALIENSNLVTKGSDNQTLNRYGFEILLDTEPLQEVQATWSDHQLCTLNIGTFDSTNILKKQHYLTIF